MSSLAARLTSESPIIHVNMNITSYNNNILRQLKHLTDPYEFIPIYLRIVLAVCVGR